MRRPTAESDIRRHSVQMTPRDNRTRVRRRRWPNAEVHPFLWYAEKAEEGRGVLRVDLPDSRVLNVHVATDRFTERTGGSVKVVEFLLCGQHFTAMTAAGPTRSTSDLARRELRDAGRGRSLWNALIDGGKAEACGC